MAGKKNKSGKKPILNEKLINKICGYISNGNFANVACAYSGISESVFYKWQQRAQDDLNNNKRTIYVQFVEALKQASAEAEMKCVEAIQEAAQNGTWQAAAWYLERKHNNRWGVKHKIDETKKILNINPAELSIEQLKAICEIDPSDEHWRLKINAIAANAEQVSSRAEEAD